MREVGKIHDTALFQRGAGISGNIVRHFLHRWLRRVAVTTTSSTLPADVSCAKASAGKLNAVPRSSSDGKVANERDMESPSYYEAIVPPSHAGAIAHMGQRHHSAAMLVASR
jgi:hypothetical protein